MEDNSLKPILLRSRTPVLKYLEAIQAEGADFPASHSDIGDAPKEGSVMNGAPSAVNGTNPLASPKIFSPIAKSHSSEAQLANLASSPVSYGQHNGAEVDDDAKSNTQDGQRTEVGSIREPGPADPPGPKYESYDSGPSFGNFGPLPDDAHHYVPPPGTYGGNPYANGWQPNWAGSPQQAVRPDMPWGQEAHGPPSQFSAVRVPLPESVASPRANSSVPIMIDVESPSSPSRSRSRASKAPSKAPSSAVPPRPQSKASNRDDRPLSPLSRGTARPPVLEDGQIVYDDDNRNRRSLSKAPSLAPSDSLSQFHVKARKKAAQAARASPDARSQGSAPNGQGMPYFPYRNAPTQADLMYAATRGRAMVIPEEMEEGTQKTASVAPSQTAQSKREPSVAPSHHSKQPSAVGGSVVNGKTASHVSSRVSPSKKAPSQVSTSTAKQGPPKSIASRHSHGPSQASHHPSERDGTATPTPSRPNSNHNHPEELNLEEQAIVERALASSRTPRTSYYASSTLEPDVKNSHFHDADLCVLLHQESDPNVHEVVKRALRKAIRQRVKRLGMKSDNETILGLKRAHNHDPSVHLDPEDDGEEPPKWATDLKRELVLMQQRIESLGPKIENLRSPQMGPARSHGDGSRFVFGEEGEEYTQQSPATQTVDINTRPTGTMADSMYQQNPTDEDHFESRPAGSQQYDDEEHGDEEYDNATADQQRGYPALTDGETRASQLRQSDRLSELRDDSPGQQFLEEELYKLRQKPAGSQSGLSHHTWEVARDDDPEEFPEDEDGHSRVHADESNLPTIPDMNGPLPPVPADGSSRDVVSNARGWLPGEYSQDGQTLAPWQKIHARLLNWAMIWPISELDSGLNSTTRGHQVDEIALSIWTTQTYKRYVRARLTDNSNGVVDRLFVPPNMADAISTAVFNGRHGDACGMLRDLWTPFGLEGMPRLLVVLAKHRSDENHWVVHRFSLPDGGLTTYDSYPERTLPDGRPLGWWFAIRIAWPNTIYPSPDHLMQKMVRLHRPMQLPIDNSVAAAGIWRNILMGSRAERSLDLERLRDLINTEVKNLRQRKLMGKLSIGASRPAWDDMN
ncbi:hypothetical protein PC9H_007334 [Pleurotus ostreatus]|uniref:Uncharacterized protein n=1 Tax=Pleurotus ostreatus TaxID=5322 RepID=A0A8H6ZR35_PLEOS|nr:uncharacterized protein PC9H_007334 [Pleurotus ostreatus]KAF7428115.1 hypothetical protein PC9H_007334 [Pleurotus ostreatus]